MQRFISSEEMLQGNKAKQITVKVVYLGMSAQMGGMKSKYLTLPAPAHLNNVLIQIKQNHANLDVMLPTSEVSLIVKS